MFYFAYGSNMSHTQMKSRCSDSSFLFPAFLVDYKFVYEGDMGKWNGAVGNIVRSPKDIVWGGVYEISEDDLKALDKHEHYPKVYDRDNFEVESEGGKKHQVISYFKKPEAENEPSDKYRQTCVLGAKECGLPQDYIDEMLD